MGRLIGHRRDEGAHVDRRTARQPVQRAVEEVGVVEHTRGAESITAADVEHLVAAIQRARPRQLVADEQFRLTRRTRGDTEKHLVAGLGSPVRTVCIETSHRVITPPLPQPSVLTRRRQYRGRAGEIHHPRELFGEKVPVQ